MSKRKIFFIFTSLIFCGCLDSSNSSKSERVSVKFQDKEILSIHNQARAKVGVSPLLWSGNLERIAKDYAEVLAQKCKLQHSKNRLGENLYRTTAIESFSPAEGVLAWLNEKEHYDYRTNSSKNGETVGHYTQIIWKDTKELGCGYAQSSCGVFMVCNYFPAGNVVGKKPY